jgi:transposase
MVRWADGIAEPRNKQIAVVALARKLVGILWAMWCDGTAYEASKTAVPAQTERR